MSIIMCFYNMDIEILDYLEKYPKQLYKFVAGEPPAYKQAWMAKQFGNASLTMDPPSSWPKVQPEPELPETNHRMGYLLRYLLNGSYEHQKGGFGIFETWFYSKKFEGYYFPKGDGGFGLQCSEVEKFANAFAKLTFELIKNAVLTLKIKKTNCARLAT